MSHTMKTHDAILAACCAEKDAVRKGLSHYFDDAEILARKIDGMPEGHAKAEAARGFRSLLDEIKGDIDQREAALKPLRDFRTQAVKSLKGGREVIVVPADLVDLLLAYIDDVPAAAAEALEDEAEFQRRRNAGDYHA
ncbi:hypothetical protein ACOI1H_23645 [Loktanella sp. DJP18]|uniref:hypothetical protein n=1 Tax=Loktanella sp. DJP18 TaxID=3409788 RepID=UPI003BB56A78